MNIFDQRGKRIATVVDGIVGAGRHKVFWNAAKVPAGVYVCRTAIDGMLGRAESIVIGK